MKEHSENEQYNKITNTLITVVLIISVVACLYVVLQVLSQGYVSVAGYSVFRVVTGSMEPAIPVGSLLVTQSTDIAQIQVGDIVCFRSQEAGMLGEIITHRVRNILYTPEGTLLLETKGDANLVADGYYVSQRHLVGKVLAYTGRGNPLSDIMSFLTSQTGFLMCIIMPSLLISALIMRDCVASIRGELDKAMETLLEEENFPYKYITKEEYQQMYERIRLELMEELGILPPPASEPLITQEEYETMREQIRAELAKELEQDVSEEQHG